MTDYFMYVDESGDVTYPINNDSQMHYFLTGIVMPCMPRSSIAAKVENIERVLIEKYDIKKPIDEIKGRKILFADEEFDFLQSKKSQRIEFYEDTLQLFLQVFSDIKIINVGMCKPETPPYKSFSYKEVITWTWDNLFLRFDNYLKFSKHTPDNGQLICDKTNKNIAELVQEILDRMKKPYKVYDDNGKVIYDFTIKQINPEIKFIDSRIKSLVQLADLVVYAFYLKKYPKGSWRKYNAHKLFDILDNHLYKKASNKDIYWEQGVVWLP